MQDYFFKGLIYGFYPMNIIFSSVITVIILRINLIKKLHLLTGILGAIFILHSHLLLNLYSHDDNLDFTFYFEIVINALLMIFLPIYLIAKYRFRYHSILSLSVLSALLVVKISFMVANNFAPQYEIAITDLTKFSTPFSKLFYVLGSALATLFVSYTMFRILKKQVQKHWFKILEITLFILVAFYSLTSTAYFLMLINTQNVA